MVGTRSLLASKKSTCSFDIPGFLKSARVVSEVKLQDYERVGAMEWKERNNKRFVSELTLTRLAPRR